MLPGASGATLVVPPTSDLFAAPGSAEAGDQAPSRLSVPAPSAPDRGPLELGTQFGTRYHIIRLLGIGGMGAVYQAWDAELGVTVALKVVRPEVAADPAAARDLERRFKRELLLARQVTHPNVVRIHDLGEINGIKYITMPFVEGEDLATILRREGVLAPVRVLRVMRTMLAGLAAAHKAGVVHRDLKPANVMLTADDQAMIMDFGIARSAGPSEGEPGAEAPPGLEPPAGLRGETRLGSIVGTIEYMAPEQAKGEAVDQRADLYAFGLICYDMLAGRRRHERAASAFNELLSRMTAAPPAPRSVNPEVPEALDRIVMRCLQPDPGARFQTSAEVADQLVGLDDEGAPLPPVRKLTPRLVAAVGVLVAALVAGTWYFSKGPAPVEQRAPISVLVADFENRTGDPVFTGAVEQALTAGVEGAAFIVAHPRADARTLAAEIKQGSPLDETMARLIAGREGINVIVTGRIERRGNGFAVLASAIDPGADPGKGGALATATASAPGRDSVLNAAATVASEIRRGLGDSTPESVRLAAADTFTASSLEAVQIYTTAQNLQTTGRKAEALEAYKRAVELDPRFGLACSGAAIMAFELGRRDEAEALWKRALTLLDRMTDRERYRTLGAYYLGVVRNFQKAIETYQTLVRAYPADRSGRANLALAHFWALDFPKALEEGRGAVELNPRNLLHRSNYSLYAMYAGDFATARRETETVLKAEPAFYVAYVPLAMAALVAGRFDEARDVYDRMSKTGPTGSSLAALGLGDMAIYQGQYDAAVAVLRAGIQADRAAGSVAGVACKLAALAEAFEGRGRSRDAVAAAKEALALTHSTVVAVAAARVLLRAGQEATAASRASELGQRLQPQDRAYGKTLESEVALRARRFVEAVEAAVSGQRLADFWLGRFVLGITYVEAGHYAEGLAELDACMKRRGEATAIGLDEMPSFRYLATLPYWLARAQQGVGLDKPAQDHLRAFLALRGHLEGDPLVVDARRRLATE